MQKWALAAGIVLMVVWGVNFVVTKIVLAGLGVAPFLFLRFLLMPLLGFALLLAVYRRHIAKSVPRREDIPRFFAAGLIGHTAHVGIVMWGMDLSTPFSSSLVLTSSPLFTLLILVVLGGERLQSRQVAGTLAAFAGIVVFLSDKFAAGFARAGFGDLMLLGAAALFSLYTVIAKPLVTKYGPLNLMCWSLAFGAPPMLLLTLNAFVDAPLAKLGAGVWFATFWAIVVSSFVGWLAWAWINSVRGLAKSAPLHYLMPPIAGLVSWLTVGESFTWLKVTGALVTLAGIAWAQLGTRSPTPPDAG